MDNTPTKNKLKQTTEEYFEENEFSIDAFNKKYKLENFDEQYVEAIWRVCNFIASVEKFKELRKYWAKRWFDEIYNDWWHPAGSIMQGAGSGKKISLSNCTTISLGNIDEDNEWDNLESIIKNAAFNVAKTAAYRQGLGIDFSKLRPKSMKVHNSSNYSEGAIHWMKFIDSIGYYVGQKGRIPAMLFSLSCFEKNTMILTNKGLMTIKDIVDDVEGGKSKDILIWTHLGYKKITGSNKKYNQEIYEIEDENGNKIKVTPDHEFVVYNTKTKKEYLKQIKDINPEFEELIFIDKIK